MSVPSDPRNSVAPVDAASAYVFKRETVNAIVVFGFLAIVAVIGFSRYAPALPVPAPVAPTPVVAPAISCQCGTSKTSRPFRVTCPTCHYDLTVVPPILPTGDFGKVAKTGTGELPK